MSSNLNPSFCADITGLKDFLRLSRSLVDDTITQNLNNLVLPPRFDPTSTARSEKKVVRTPIDKGSCSKLVETIFENWDARSSTIDYCLSTTHLSIADTHSLTAEETRARRLDPYSGRQTTEEPILRHVCLQEQGTEQIIRDRTWRVVRGRCQDLNDMDRDWQTAFESWRSKKGSSNDL